MPIEELILGGRLDQAAYRAAARADADADAALLVWLRDFNLPRERGAPWRSAFRLASAQLRAASPSIAVAVRKYLARGFARAVELEGGRGALSGGESPGAYLLLAELPGEAAEVLFANLAREPASGPVALLLANALHRLGRPRRRRGIYYRRALRVAPLAVDLTQIEDEEVRSLVTLATNLGLPGDPRPWLPALGWLEELLRSPRWIRCRGPASATAPAPTILLIAHKGSRSHGERAAILRDLQALAPSFFAALGAAGKLGPEGGRAGSA